MYIFAVQLLIVVSIFVLAVLSGGVSNVTSGGAGLLTIFILTTFVSLPIQESTGTVLAASTFIVLVGAISFWRKKQVNRQLAITVGLSGVLGAFLGARWASSIHSSSIEEAFGAFTLVMAGYMTYSFISDRQRRDRTSMTSIDTIPTAATRATIGKSQAFANRSRPSVAQGFSNSVREGNSRWGGTDPLAIAVQIAKGVLIGVATGIFGVGLASLGIVLFILLFKLEMKMIIGTSLFASFFRYLGGSFGYLTVGLINPFYFALIAIGGILGSLIGAKMILGKGRGSNIWYVKPVIIAVLLFISYEFLLKYYVPIHLFHI